MNINLPPVGHEFAFKGDQFTVGFISNKTVRFTAVAGGREQNVPVDTFLKMMASDDFKNISEDWTNSFSRFSKKDISTRNELASLIRHVESLTKSPCSQKVITPILDEYARKHKVKIISASNFAKKYKAYKDAKGNINALLPNHHLKGNRKLNFNTELEALASKVLHRDYFQLNGKTLKRTYKNFRLDAMDTETFQADPENFKLMSFATFRRRALDYDINYRLASRHGLKLARSMLRASGEKLETGFPLENVEADGYYVDCIVVDEETGEVLGRPYLTLFIDRATRCVLSFHMSLRAFCVETLLVAFKDALREDNNLPGGRISNVIVDNGSDFKSHSFRSAILSVGADLKPCRINDPNSKPFVESVLRTFSIRCFHELQGTTFSNPNQRGDYDSHKQSIYTLDELNEIFRTAVDDYHIEIHSQLENAPELEWNNWKKQMDGLLHEVSLSEIESLLRDVKIYNINKGTIRFHGLSYKSHDLSAIEVKMKQLGRKTKVHVYIDNSDLSHVYVENPLDQKSPLIKALSREPKVTNNLTMFEHKQNMEKENLKKLQQQEDLKSLGVDQRQKNNKAVRDKLKKRAELRKKRHLEALKQNQRSSQNTNLEKRKNTQPLPRAELPESSSAFGNMVWGDENE